MYPGTRGLAYDVAVAALAGSWRHIILWIRIEYSDRIRSNYNHTPCILNSCVFSIGTVKVIKVFDQLKEQNEENGRSQLIILNLHPLSRPSWAISSYVSLLRSPETSIRSSLGTVNSTIPI